MERTGVTPPGAVVAPDLADIVASTGPFLTVYLTTEAGIDNAAHRSEQHWKALRQDLAADGVPEDALAAIDPVVSDAHLQGQTLAAIATADGLAHVENGDEPPPRDRGSWAPVPALVPILEWRQSHPPHIGVLADRAGADIVVVRHGRPDVHREAGGDDDPLHRAKPGGWSQLRYQHRAENTWESNADDVAAQITDLFDRVGARLVVVAGDVRAVQMIQDALPDRVTERVEVVDGSRAQDGSEDEFSAEVHGRLSGATATDTVQLVEKFREELGQDDRAADGPEATFAALAAARVEVLLVHEDLEDDRTAFFGPESTAIGLRADDVAALGVEEPLEGRLVDVAVRAALATSAGIRVLPAGLRGSNATGGQAPTGGLGAILRW